MTRVINKVTGEEYLSAVDIEKKRWLQLMEEENPEFFDRNPLAQLFFLPSP